MRFQIPSHIRNLISWAILIFLGILFLYPTYNFQAHLAQGDHGNNLYAFKRTMDGAIPFKDYWWVYGPLMPYYYALLYHLFGISIHSVLLGYNILNFLCGVVLFMTLRLFFANYLSILAAVTYWVFFNPFEHTYNHVGGVLMIGVIYYYLMRYLKDPQIRFVHRGLFFAFILSLIKFNFGFANLAGMMLSVFLIDRYLGIPLTGPKKKAYLLAFIGYPALVLLIHGVCLYGLRWDEIRQCILFVDTDPNHATVLQSLKVFWDYYFVEWKRQNNIWCVIIVYLSSAAMIFCIIKKRFKDKELNMLLMAIALALIGCILNLHEFVVSGVAYRTFWIEPIRYLVIFMIMGYVLARMPKPIIVIVSLVFLWASLHNTFIRTRYLAIVRQYVPIERGNVYITNASPWLKTVMTVTYFLKKHLKDNETFLALPSEQLYYFFTDRICPTRQTEYGIKISVKQEKEAIRVLEERKDVRYVLLSNHYRAPETGLGPMGQAYGKLLAAYIGRNYKVIAMYGDWFKEPLWFSNHGVVIMERK